MESAAECSVRVPRPGASVSAALLLTALALPAAPARGLWVRLSSGSPFSNVVTGQTNGPLATARWALFVHDADVDQAFELWSVPSFGGTQQRISGILPANWFVRQFDVDASGTRAVYLAPVDTLDVDELYSVPVSGGIPVKLNPSLPPGRDVKTFRISPNGQRVVYLADQDSAGVDELYSVPIVGGTATKLSGTLVTGGNVVYAVEISGDSQRVVFEADRTLDEVEEVLSVPIAGGAITRLDASPAGRSAFGSRISPDSQRVVYFAQQDTAGIWELYSVPIAGGASVKLNGPLVAGAVIQNFQISPDGQRVAYVADQLTLNVWELFGAPITGGGWVKLSGALVPGGYVDSFSYSFSPDSQRVVYKADQQTLNVWELFSAPATGGSAVKLNGTLVSGGDVVDFQFSPSSQWVVYRADQTIDGLPVGVRVPLAGPAASGQYVWQGPVTSGPSDWQIAPDGQSIVVQGNAVFVDGIVRLWRFPLEGTLNPTGSELVPVGAFQVDGDVVDFTIGADGAILYVADQLSDGINELFTVPVAIFWDGFASGGTTAWSSVVP